VGQGQLLEQQQRTHGEDRRQRLVGLSQLAAEGGAAVAGAQVAAAGRADPPANSLRDFSELQADVLARQQARLGGFRQ
jgi:hypothetical protein